MFRPHDRPGWSRHGSSGRRSALFLKTTVRYSCKCAWPWKAHDAQTRRAITSKLFSTEPLSLDRIYRVYAAVCLLCTPPLPTSGECVTSFRPNMRDKGTCAQQETSSSTLVFHGPADRPPLGEPLRGSKTPRNPFPINMLVGRHQPSHNPVPRNGVPRATYLGHPMKSFPRFSEMRNELSTCKLRSRISRLRYVVATKWLFPSPSGLPR
ncbi:hypothetical protein V8E53_001785 [Lactarius tabidus]